MRINKYLALCGVGSRRKCDDFISSGQVLINGEIAKIGQDICDTDIITINGQRVEQNDEFYYYILNKPKGCICTMADDRGRRTIIDVFNEAYVGSHKGISVPLVYPVGRLDYNTQGIIVMTNDGEFANSLIHPSKKIVKCYRALIYPHITGEEIRKLENGVVIEGVKTLPSKVKVIKTFKTTQLVEVSIIQGRNRQIHNMFEKVGKRIDELERISIGRLGLGDLARGAIREMTTFDRELVLQNE